MTCSTIRVACRLIATAEPASALWPPAIVDPHHVAGCNDPPDVEATPAEDFGPLA